jgi:hypothetical protein
MGRLFAKLISSAGRGTEATIMQVVRRTVCSLALVLLAAGCDAGMEPLAPVQGKVAYKGIPLHTGTIVFTPDELRGTSGPLGCADIEADGTYRLRSGTALGAVIGWHRVTIVALQEAPPLATDHAFTIPRSLLPDKYRDPELSGLTCEVKAGQHNVIDFNLD